MRCQDKHQSRRGQRAVAVLSLHYSSEWLPVTDVLLSWATMAACSWEPLDMCWKQDGDSRFQLLLTAERYLAPSMTARSANARMLAAQKNLTNYLMRSANSLSAKVLNYRVTFKLV